MTTLLRCAVAGALAMATHAADFSYYMLTLSDAPEFCSHTGGKKDPRECGTGRPTFVVHGLWPQNENGRGPENCGPASPVSAAVVRLMLHYIPTEGLIQHEWAAHGTCSGSSADDYFALVRKARDSIRIPPAFDPLKGPLALSPHAVEAAFQAANPGVPIDGIRTACYSDGGLQEVRICFDKQLAPRPCTGVAECAKTVVRVSDVRKGR